MGKDSNIQWTHHTFNPWRGCQKVSDGCKYCYAETLSRRNPATLGVWGPGGTRVVAAESYWKQPIKWDREAEAAGDRHRVFCASLADVFEDWRGPMFNSWGETLWMTYSGYWMGSERRPNPDVVALTMDDVRRRLFALISGTPNLDWLVLTKRPENVMPFARRAGHDTDSDLRLADYMPLGNVWFGTSVEDQAAADTRIPHLLAIPAAVRFLSCEPLLGSVDLRLSQRPGIHWAIAGGESGSKARSFHLDWARSIRDECRAAGVACFIKQMGSHPIEGGRRLKLRDSHGGDWDEFPADLRIREFPEAEVARA